MVYSISAVVLLQVVVSGSTKSTPLGSTLHSLQEEFAAAHKAGANVGILVGGYVAQDFVQQQANQIRCEGGPVGKKNRRRLIWNEQGDGTFWCNEFFNRFANCDSWCCTCEKRLL